MKIYTAAILVLISSIGSFVAGTRLGAEAFIQADAKFNAALITAKLSDLENDNLKRLRASLEFDRDLSLIRHGEGERNLLIYIWPDLLHGENKELGLRSLHRAATYRKSHPTEWTNQKTLESFEPDTRLGVQEHGKILEWVTNKYAK
ncbi:MAG: hypothetical protein ACRCTL_17615 [Pseudomonas sp.]